MSRLFVCAVHDVAAESYGQPIFVPAKGLAIRSFIDEVNRDEKGNQLFNHSRDFRLVLLGEYNPSSGEIHCYEVQEVLMTGDSAQQVG